MKTAATRRSPDATLGATVAHPLRCRCLAILADRVASPVEIAREIGLEVSKVGYHVTALAEAGLVEEVGQRPVRGAVEHFYRAIQRPVLSPLGRKHQKHPPQPDWTTADALEALGHVMHQELPVASS